MIIKKMSAATVIATVDAGARTSVKGHNGHSQHLPSFQAAEQHIPQQEVVRSFSANTLGSWSSYSQFTLTPDMLPDYIDTLTLVITLAAGTATSKSYLSLVNDGSFLAKLVEIRLGGQLLSSLYPEAWYVNPIIHWTNEQKLKYLPGIGNNTQTVRRAAGIAGQVLYINVPVPWITSKGWFVKQALGQQLDIKIYHNDLNTIVQTDGTSPSLTISSLTLNVSGRNYLSQANQMAAINNVRRLGTVHQRFLDPVQQQFTLASGSSQYTIQLTNMNGLYSHLLFVIRAASSISTPLGNAPDNFVALTSYSFLDSAGNIVLPTQTHAYALGPYAAKYTRGDFTDVQGGLATAAGQKPIYGVFFDAEPEKSMRLGTQSGLYRMDGLARLQINFASAIGSNYVVDVIGYTLSSLETSGATGVTTKSLVVA